MRQRHASGLRFYLTVFSVEPFIYPKAITFSDYLVDFSLGCQEKLSETPFVPVKSTGYKGDIKRLQPNRCFLGKQDSKFHPELFAFVDFGTRVNKFLKYCHTRDEPSTEDIARVLLANPSGVYSLVRGREG